MNKQITRISDIHRDIWFEIFRYFYADELFYTFANVLNEIDSILLNDIRLRLHIRIDYELTSKILLQINPTQIISLSIEEMENNQTDINEMIYLQSILIKDLHFTFYNDRGPYLFNLALHIPNLKQLKFNDMSNWEMDYYQNEIIQTNILSMEKFFCNFYCQFEYIKKILFYLPNLRILRLKLLRGNDNFTENPPEVLFNYIRKIHLTLCDISFDVIISFLQIMPNISIIIIDGNIWGTNVIAYFQIEKWLNMISFLNINNKQKKIFVDLDLRQDYSNLSTNNIGIINYDQFQKIGLQLTLYTIKGLIQL